MSSPRPAGAAATLCCALFPALSWAANYSFSPDTPAGTTASIYSTLVASDDLGVELDVDLTGLDARVLVAERGVFALLALDGAGFNQEPGQPMLPVLREYIEIPLDSEPVLSVDAVEYQDLYLEDLLGASYPVLPAQPSVPKIPGVQVDFAWDREAYGQMSLDHQPWASLGPVGRIRAHRFVSLRVAPVRYDPQAGRIRLLKHLEISLDYGRVNWDLTEQVRERYASPDFDHFAQRTFLNAPAFSGKAFPQQPMSYLFIVPDDYIDDVEELAQFRHKLGYRVSTVPLSQISGGGRADDIRNFIQSAYDTWEFPPTFVLLVGDTDQVPCFTGDRSRSATDLYYTTMDGDDDWLPDIYLGRFSADTAQGVALMAEKTMSYINFALSSGTDWVERDTFMASSDNFSISEGSHDYCIETWLDPMGYESARRYSHSFGATTQEVLDDIEQGIGLLTYSGHGSTDSWTDGPPVESYQVESLGNVDMLPVVQSYACDTGNYARSCFAETWTLAENGAIAFWGSSTSSLWDEDDILERGVYDAWFGEDYTWFRGALNQGLSDVYDAYSGGRNSQSYYEQYNLFGDPALDVWTEPPQDLDVDFDQEIPVGSDLLRVLVGDGGQDPVEGALVCLYMDGVIYETALTDSAGAADLFMKPAPLEPGTAELHVSRHNFVPFAGTVEILEDLPRGDTDNTDTGFYPVDSGDPQDGRVDSGAGKGSLQASPGCGCQASGGGAMPYTMLMPLVLLTRRRSWFQR